MEQNKLDRINELARKAKSEGLSPAEKEEQQTLRQEYIEAYRRSLRSQLESMIIVDKDGNQRPVTRKGDGKGKNLS